MTRPSLWGRGFLPKLEKAAKRLHHTGGWRTSPLKEGQWFPHRESGLVIGSNLSALTSDAILTTLSGRNEIRSDLPARAAWRTSRPIVWETYAWPDQGDESRRAGHHLLSSFGGKPSPNCSYEFRPRNGAHDGWRRRLSFPILGSSSLSFWARCLTTGTGGEQNCLTGDADP